MTSLTARRVDLSPGRVTQISVLHSEWIKLRSLRSTLWTLLATVAITVGLGSLFSVARAHRFNELVTTAPNGVRLAPRFDPTVVSLRGVFLAQLAIGVLGVLMIAGEYGTGMIRSSLAAVPQRVPVLAAKAIVFATAAFVVSIVSAFAAFLLGQQALSSTHFQASLGTPHAIRAIFGAAIYLTLIGLMAVGLGFVLRNTAAAIASLFGVVLVAPLLANALPTPYSTDISKYLPLNAGTQILQTKDYDPSQLHPWAGVGVTALYAIVALIAGTIVLLRRDA